MLIVPPPGFGKIIASHNTVRPAAAYGQIVTASQSPAFGTWALVISGGTVTDRVCGILININSTAVSATNKEVILDLGIDEAGGTSYTTLIASIGANSAYAYNVGTSGCWYSGGGCFGCRNCELCR